MAEPIRKPIHPLHRPSLHGPRNRPRHPLPAASRSALRIADGNPAPPPPAPPRAAAVQHVPDEALSVQRPRTSTLSPARERRLRLFLQGAIALHLVALVPFLLSSGSAPTLSDVLLATTVLLAGGGVLTLGSAGRKDR